MRRERVGIYKRGNTFGVFFFFVRAVAQSFSIIQCQPFSVSLIYMPYIKENNNCPNFMLCPWMILTYVTHYHVSFSYFGRILWYVMRYIKLFIPKLMLMIFGCFITVDFWFNICVFISLHLIFIVFPTCTCSV